MGLYVHGQDRNHNAVHHIVALLVNGVLMVFVTESRNYEANVYSLTTEDKFCFPMAVFIVICLRPHNCTKAFN